MSKSNTPNEPLNVASLTNHPATDIFPMIDDEAYQELLADIREKGQLEDIVLYKGQVLDGRHRLRACRELGIDPEFCELDGADEADAIAYTYSLNLHRRHLTTSQRSMVAARAKESFAGPAKERRKRKPANSVVEDFPPQKRKARDAAGAAVGVSGKSVDHAAAVIEHGTPELIQAVDSGRMSVSKAAKIAKPTSDTSRPKGQSKQATNSVPRGKSKSAPSLPRLKKSALKSLEELTLVLEQMDISSKVTQSLSKIKNAIENAGNLSGKRSAPRSLGD